MVVRSSPLRTGRLYSQEYSFLEAESTPEHMVPSVATEKFPSDTTGDFFCSLYFISTILFPDCPGCAFCPYCATHTTQTSIHPAGFEPAIPASDRQLGHWDRHDPTTLRLVAQYLSHYATPGPIFVQCSPIFERFPGFTRLSV
jgi:hypothetical protein